MMDESEECKCKISSMQKYVPLLSKLIKQLEEISGNTLETIEKIKQLKTIQEQLCGQKPGILLDELDKCEIVLKNLFEEEINEISIPDKAVLHINSIEKEEKENSSAGLHEEKQENVVILKETINSEQIPKLIAAPNDATADESQEKSDFPTDTIENDKNKFEDTAETTVQESLNSSESSEKIKERNSEDSISSKEANTISEQKKLLEKCNLTDVESENGNEIQDEQEKTDIIKQIIPSEISDEIVKGNSEQEEEITDISFEEPNVEIIEFSEDENISDDDECELIVPDDEEISFPLKLNEEEEPPEICDENKNENSTQNSEILITTANFIEENESKKEQLKENEKETENSELNNEFSDTLKESNELSMKENISENELLEKETTTTTTCNVGGEILNDNNCAPTNNGTIQNKEINEQPYCTVPPVSQSVENIEIQCEKRDKSIANENSMKRHSAEAECSADCQAKKQKLLDSNEDEDPLTMDDNLTAEIESTIHEDDEDNDDVEIIEPDNTPILIESDDDEIRREPPPIRVPQPAPRAPFAFKSTNPNKNAQIPPKIYNIGKSRYTIKSTPQKFVQKPSTVGLADPKLIFPKPQTRKNSFLSNIDLQPTNTDPNPRLFKTQVGEKLILIPNAFYGCPGHSSAQTNTAVKEHQENHDPDMAHRRWLNNFLHHFCNSRNIAHNTCYLLLQKTLHKDDFERICRQRSAMKTTAEAQPNKQLLRQLRAIFYVEGGHMDKRLSFSGRKFCQNAFLNILDKTISLTTDSVTNTVTSRTRISAATLEAARAQLLNFEAAAPPACAPSINQNYQSNENANAIIGDPLNSTSSTGSTKKGREDDSEYCPPREIAQEIADNTSPRRSLRNSTQRQSPSISSTRFTYDETEDEETPALAAEEPYSPQVLEKREKPILTAATEAFISQKRLEAIEERQKLAKSFEMSFIESSSQYIINRNSEAPQEVPVSFLQQQESSNLSIVKPNDVLVISDDDDDIEKQELRTHLIYKNTSLKINTRDPVKIKEYLNISSEMHSMSKFVDFCIICDRRVNRVVGHYVNVHPNDEVFVSRPTPKMAKAMLDNKLTQPTYDRLYNRLSLYNTTCVFCEKNGSFTLQYWYQHLATHTGEYAFRCSACGIKTATRTQLLSHVRLDCYNKGNLEVIQEYDMSTAKIILYTCRFCYYTQLNHNNVLRHLKNQHKMPRVDKCNVIAVTFLDAFFQFSSPSKTKKTNGNGNGKQTMSKGSPIYVAAGENEVFEIAEINNEDMNEGTFDQPLVVNEAANEEDWYNDDPSALLMNSYLNYPKEFE